MSSDSKPNAADLCALIGSRICHDLISPIGAIGNGLELLSMSGGGDAEVALITESVANANARIRFFRIAFGKAAAEQGTPRAEIQSILKDVYGGGRIRLDWQVASDCRREEAKAAFLALQCLESALPHGGEIEAGRKDGHWRFTARGGKLKVDPALWDILCGEAPRNGLEPKHVQFALLPEAIEPLGRQARVDRGESTVTLSY